MEIEVVNRGHTLASKGLDEDLHSGCSDEDATGGSVDG